ncbi:hypothetical protein HNR00_003400 [Methylorubrum rhodinum]|uniref:Uncharacterized protein n=1 Tax=Methylorubrum rhodinum TaxID=29428 RepID=A0A840ZP54_9HYPH|nr:hypothetical protein [Methylorubrum rhodinum]MBB5758677.1 hypothetical protein [Methylorubrum rhodinum]
MMEAGVSRSWKEQFAIAAAMREEDIKHREKLLRFDARQRTMREDERVRTEKRDRETFAAVQAVLATDKQVATFTTKLDRYNEKTVEALMENRIALDEVQTRLDEMLGKAHVLPDGRRVFKTQDGTRVFDEGGIELNADVIDPNAIADERPPWERYKASLDTKTRLEQERSQLHNFQAKSDAAREELDRGNVTADRLDELDAEMQAAMPEAVRRKLGNEGPTRNADGPAPEPASRVRVGATLNDQRPTGFAPM